MTKRELIEALSDIRNNVMTKDEVRHATAAYDIDYLKKRVEKEGIVADPE